MSETAEQSQEHDGPEAPENGGKGRVVDAAADGHRLDDEQVNLLTQYFLGGKPAPGASQDEWLDREVNIGSDAEPRWMRLKLRTVEWDEWQICQQEGTIRRKGEDVIDGFRRASYTVAYATADPDLGALRMQIPEEWADESGEERKRPADTAELLRVFFRKIPGALLDIENEVLGASKLLTAKSAVREVTAAGN